MEGYTAIANINYVPFEDLSFNVSCAYSRTTAQIQSINFAPTEWAFEETAVPEHRKDRRFFDYDFSSVPGYSDLHIKELDLVFNTSYQISKNFALGLEYNYIYYGDEEPIPATYDTTGRAHIGMLTLTYSY